MGQSSNILKHLFHGGARYLETLFLQTACDLLSFSSNNLNKNRSSSDKLCNTDKLVSVPSGSDTDSDTRVRPTLKEWMQCVPNRSGFSPRKRALFPLSSKLNFVELNLSFMFLQFQNLKLNSNFMVTTTFKWWKKKNVVYSYLIPGKRCHCQWPTGQTTDWTISDGPSGYQQIFGLSIA